MRFVLWLLSSSSSVGHLRGPSYHASPLTMSASRVWCESIFSGLVAHHIVVHHTRSAGQLACCQPPLRRCFLRLSYRCPAGRLVSARSVRVWSLRWARPCCRDPFFPTLPRGGRGFAPSNQGETRVGRHGLDAQSGHPTSSCWSWFFFASSSSSLSSSSSPSSNIRVGAHGLVLFSILERLSGRERGLGLILLHHSGGSGGVKAMGVAEAGFGKVLAACCTGRRGAGCTGGHPPLHG